MINEMQSNSEPEISLLEKLLVIIISIIIGLLWVNTAVFVAYFVWRTIHLFTSNL